MPKVLVVDDEAMIVELISETLGLDPELEITKAYDGIQAVESAFNRAPDLLILDVTLPGRDGFAVLRLLRRDRRTARCKVLMITGNNTGVAETTAMKLGADGFLAKPFQPTELLSKVGGLIRLSGVAA